MWEFFLFFFWLWGFGVPVLLVGAHESPAGVVGDLGDVVVVPAEGGDASVVVASVEHDQVDKLAEREASPDTQVVVHVDLADGHPLEVGAHGVHLPLVDADATVVDERFFGVVQAGGATTVTVVGDLMVIPDRNPGEFLV